MDKNNDILSFNKLFAEYQQRFIRFAYSYTSDLMASEDIVMEAMMYYWENRKSLNEDINPPAYILTAIKNKSLNFLRDKQVHLSAYSSIKEHEEWKLTTQISSLEACNPSALFSKEIIDKMNEAIRQMPETTKRIFIMRRFEDKSYQEIADEMNISIKGVEYHLSRATTHLKKYLKDYITLLLILLQV